MIYLDNNAATSVAIAVSDAMARCAGSSDKDALSPLSPGTAIEAAQESIATLLGAAKASDIFFTSSGTESISRAIRCGLDIGNGRDHILTTRVEHAAVFDHCDHLKRKGVQVTRLTVDGEGGLDMNELRSALTPRTAIVSIMHANDETGVLFPVAELASIVKEHSNALFHVDGVSAAGRVPFDLARTAIDLYSISGHKLHGPNGIGALYVRNGTNLSDRSSGDDVGQIGYAEIPQLSRIVGFGVAAKMASDLSQMDRIALLRDRLESEILEKIPNSRLNGTRRRDKRLPNTANISFENANGEALIALLRDAGIYASAGSACSAAPHRPSRVLEAMGLPYSYSMGSIRFSLSRYTEENEIENVLEVLPSMVASLRRMGGSA